MSALSSCAARRQPRQLIENRVSFAGPNAELSIYDTYMPARQVALSSDQVLYCGMLTGRKVMHGATDQPRIFMPGESFILAPDQQVRIDFPDARPDAPTTCMTIDIDPRRVSDVCERLNLDLPRERELDPWHYVPRALHVPHGSETQALIERIMHLFTDRHPDRDALIDLAVSELIVRMLRTQSRELLLLESQLRAPRHGLDAALQWLRNNPTAEVDGQRLAEEACMSKARLYRQFKREVGCTPCEYQQQLRMQRACQLLTASSASVTEICFELGYRSLSHFAHRFKAFTGLAPGQYRRRQLSVAS
ncbi:AraC family transcriptional regulator [Salinicola salarius]|uniref:AraC family transcriptional regulator n=1 Tax=Salinicola salarius TaxID=430457 RepID=UPI0015C59F73|nr:AraC family transcriptional regulator [Salinicola salarius]